MIGVSLRTGPVRWHGLVVLSVWLVGRLLVALAVLVHAAVCRPRLTGVLLGCTAVAWLCEQHPLVAVAAASTISGIGEAWAVRSPASFHRHVTLRGLGCWRRLTVYRRQWSAAMTVADLTQPGPDGGLRVPHLGRVRCVDGVDVVHIRGLLGQRFSEWEAAGPMLAHVFGAGDVRVHRGDDRRLTLELARAARGRSWHRDGQLDLVDRPT